MKTSISEFPSKLGGFEATGVVIFIFLVYYVFFMGGLHTLLSSIASVKNPELVWKSEGGLWDHPEPNYKVLPFVAEFFASATAIPLAGGFLLYQALRFSYNTPVLVLFLLDCWMYTCAFFSHMLLWPLLNSITLTSVLTNALYAFAVYSGIAGGVFRKWYIRVSFAITMWLCIIYMVVVLPPWFGQNGGVPALLTIQTPAVISAMAGAVYCGRTRARDSNTKTAFHLLCVSGVLLCSAMAVSLVEVLYGKQVHASITGIVPVLHMIIHTLEQIGIYLYGVGVAIIEHCMVRPNPHAKVVYLKGWLPYLAITVEQTSVVYESRAPSESPERRSSRLAARRKDM